MLGWNIPGDEPASRFGMEVGAVPSHFTGGVLTASRGSRPPPLRVGGD